MLFNDQNENTDVIDPIVEEEKEEKNEEITVEKKEDEPVVTEEQEEKAEESVIEEKIEEKPVKTEIKETNSEKPEEDMMTLLNESMNKFKKGEIITGTIVSVDEKEVLVDIGFKTESSISIREFSNTSVIPPVGQKINLYIDDVQMGSGKPRLSKRKADFMVNLDKIEEIMKNNESVEGILRRRVKGGMIVDVMDVEAFLPGSQISIKPIPNLDQFIGKKSKFKIIKIDKEKRNIIVSRKKLLEEEEAKKIIDLRERIIPGAELDGEVRNITQYGAFINLGGIDGLLHITDMSWGHVKHPSDMLNIGDKVKVKVLEYDEEKRKVSLGLKQLVPHPWENIETKYPEGTIITGKVVNLTPYGAFIELEPGVEGLVHVSELSWTKKVKHPKYILSEGDSVKAIVLSTSKEDKRISLGIKQMEPNPWVTIEERYPEGMEIDGIVKNITPFGIFVEIEENIEGLIHISDISWTKRIYNPKKLFKKSDKVHVKILSIDRTLHRIALGIKQLFPDPWEHLDEKLPINREITAKIVKLIPKGVLVDVEVDDQTVEGFVPLSHLAIPDLKKASSVFKNKEEIPLKIIELDLENRRLILSVKAYFFTKSDKELQKYIQLHSEKVKDEEKIIEELEEDTTDIFYNNENKEKTTQDSVEN